MSEKHWDCYVCGNRSPESEMELDIQYDVFFHRDCLDKRGYTSIHEYETRNQ